MAAQRFTAVVGEASRGAGRWIEVPFDARASFGEARPPVAGTVAGVPYRSRLAVYGGRTYLGLTREVRDAAGIDVGDEIEVVLDRDDAPREVSVPAELEIALSRSPSARAYYEGLAFTHRREYAQWIGEAKRPETRSRRAARAVEMLLEGVKHP